MGYPIEPAHLGGIERPSEIPFEALLRTDPAKSSSVAPATKATPNYTLSKPQLTPPKTAPRGAHKSMGSALASFVDSVETSRQSSINNGLNRLSALATEYTRYQSEKVEKMMQHADEVMQEDSWNYWKNIAYCLSSASSIVIGGSMVLSGNPALVNAGALLAASGTTALFARSMEQAKVAPELTGTVALVSAGLGIAGSLGSSYTDPLSTIKLVSGMSQAAISLAYGAATFGQNQATAEQKWLEGQLSRIQQDLNAGDLDTQKIIQDTRTTATQLNVDAITSSMRDYQRTVSRIAASSAA
jgi:hypothetical protein